MFMVYNKEELVYFYKSRHQTAFSTYCRMELYGKSGIIVE
jgi:hypothetical protein